MNEQTGKLRQEMWQIFGEMEIEDIDGISPAEAINKMLKACKEAGLKFVETGDKTDYLEYWDFGMKIREIDIGQEITE